MSGSLNALESAKTLLEEICADVSSAAYDREERGDKAAADKLLDKWRDRMFDGTLASYRDEFESALGDSA